MLCHRRIKKKRQREKRNKKNNSLQDRIFKVGHPSALSYPSHQSEFKDLFRFLGNCPPAPHLANFNTYFSLREKFRLQVGSCP